MILEEQLLQAIKYNQYETVEQLLINNDISLDNYHVNINNDTYLHIASYHGYYDIVKLLLDYSIDSSSYNKDYKFPIHHAIEREHNQVVVLLYHNMVKSSTIQPIFDIEDHAYSNIIYKAIDNANISLFIFIITNIHQLVTMDVNPLVNINQLDDNGQTILTYLLTIDILTDKHLELLDLLIQLVPLSLLLSCNQDGEYPIDILFKRSLVHPLVTLINKGIDGCYLLNSDINVINDTINIIVSNNKEYILRYLEIKQLTQELEKTIQTNVIIESNEAIIKYVASLRKTIRTRNKLLNEYNICV